MLTPGTVLADIARSRAEIDQARLLVLSAARRVDMVGAKGAMKEIGISKVCANEPEVVSVTADGSSLFPRWRFVLWTERCKSTERRVSVKTHLWLITTDHSELSNTPM
jgi:hypothetical protein